MKSALDRTLNRLRRVAPQAVQRAEHALDAALAATHASRWPEVAWRASGLTNTGFPVELSWSSRDTAIRWAAESSSPETPEHDRLDQARAVLRTLGAEVALPDWLTNREPSSRFGAWIGGRHDAAHDRYKLYVEMATTPLLGEEILDAIPARTQWRMAGVDSSVIEVYAKLPRPEVWEVERLLSLCGLDGEPLFTLAARLFGRGLPASAGFSLALAGERVAAAALIAHSSPLFGADDAVARKLREAARHYGWDTSLYEAILGHDEPEHPGRHGMIGVGVTKGGEPWLQIGLRP